MSKRSDPFEALAHPIRRDILGALRDEPGLSAGAIAARFPEVSRPAISRHLGVLRSAHLVRARPDGRELRYHLDPEAIAALHERWCVQFGEVMEQSLRRLKERVEAAGEQTR